MQDALAAQFDAIRVEIKSDLTITGPAGAIGASEIPVHTSRRRDEIAFISATRAGTPLSDAKVLGRVADRAAEPFLRQIEQIQLWGSVGLSLDHFILIIGPFGHLPAIGSATETQRQSASRNFDA
jgi:hypothetical protein